MSEIAPPAGGGPNRLFLALAIGLAGLLVLGLIGVVGVLAIPRLLGTNAPPPTLRVAVANTSTPTRAPTVAPTTAPTTAVPTETATPTLVLASGGGTTQSTPTIIGGTGTPTIIGGGGTSTPAGTTTPGTLPQSGMGEDLLLLGGGVVLVLIIFAARRARTA